jgi:hypothetical protein
LYHHHVCSIALSGIQLLEFLAAFFILFLAMFVAIQTAALPNHGIFCSGNH